MRARTTEVRVEVSSVVAPMLEQLCALHAQGEAHGNVSLATMTIRVIEPADGTLHLPDAECCNEVAQRSCAMCQRAQTEVQKHTSTHTTAQTLTYAHAQANTHTYIYI